MVIYRLSMLTLLSMGLVSCGEDTILGCANEPPGSLITNVEVIDGSGSAAISVDVRINDGLISDIGDLTPCNGEIVVDGGGHTLAPGFIDTHSHADGLIFERPDALSAVSPHLGISKLNQFSTASADLNNHEISGYVGYVVPQGFHNW